MDYKTCAICGICYRAIIPMRLCTYFQVLFISLYLTMKTLGMKWHMYVNIALLQFIYNPALCIQTRDYVIV